ncbi:hypothetical protein ACHHYP_08135 [Achlya hypogyna]|uniref:EF-hand domain-containing protein n=1 Tax=Achlya hypogyna TaxID=1202772 RepID=A0A1V9ZL64_ACHHY|nr:hypothetical protein ACHHYP_08135 [Achlya hypogyna]
MNGNLERQQLEEASRSLNLAIEKSQTLQKLARLNQHYRDVGIDDVRLHEAGCVVALASVKRLLAELSPDGTFSLATTGTDDHATKRASAMTDVEALLVTARATYDSILGRPAECQRGKGNILRERGTIFYHANNLESAEMAWVASCECYEELGDASATSDLLKKLEKLRHARDVANYAAQLVERTAENHERDALLKAFNKFDRDRSGEIDTAEFAALSVELGTYPALTTDEIKEAFAQLDTSANQKISFAEFWAWWCTDEIQAFAHKHKVGRK